MLTAENLIKNYGAKSALRGVSFTARSGELVGLIGQNGAGKSTLLQILAGHLAPTQGKCTIDGCDILWQPELTKDRIGYMPEKPALYPEMTVSEELRFVCRLKHVVNKDIERHILDLAEHTGITNVLGRRIGNLSKGYLQRVSLACALVGHPDVILLDEPTSGLDPVQIKEFRTLISELARERLVILSTHILRDLDSLCTRALILHEGRLIKDLVTDDQALSRKTLRVQVALGLDAARRLFDSLSGVESVSIIDHEPGLTTALISCAKDLPVERQLFQLLKPLDAPVLQLTPVRSELEEIFLNAISTVPSNEVTPC